MRRFPLDNEADMTTQNNAAPPITEVGSEDSADTRRTWERPALRRLGANEAANTNLNYVANDGVYYFS